MEIEFIGVGEAFEPQLGNTSFLLKSHQAFMIDCGYGVPRLFFEKGYPSDLIDILYITHFHADHFFGLPILFNYWKEEGRTKPLVMIGQPGLEQMVLQVLELGYPGTRAKLPYPLHFIENDIGVTFQEWELQFAETQHSIRNLAVKIQHQGIRIGISGDGDLSDASRQLFQDCHVLIHDAFQLNKSFRGHSTAESVVQFARSLPELKTLALVHIHRRERQQSRQAFLDLGKDCPFEVIIPQPGDQLQVSFFEGGKQK